MILRTTLEYIGFRGLQDCHKPKAEDNIEDRENKCCPKDHSIFVFF